MSHSPYADQNNVGTLSLDIETHFSSALPADLSWQDYISVTQGHPDIGLDISDSFEFAFKALVDGEPSTRVMVAKLKDGLELQADSHYFVRIKSGIKPITGYMLPEDYIFSFTTISALSANAPEFVSITPAQGDVAGGTDILIEGYHFSQEIKLELGGLP